MKRKFPVGEVEVIEKDDVAGMASPLYSSDSWQVSQKAFFMDVERVGRFYVHDGKVVEYSVAPGADREWVDLYLNGQVLVALLHQRKIINFHASSFVYQGRGLMILGETGAGKTSLTVAFTLNSARFLSDDLTPVVFRDSVPHIWSIHRNVKLRADSIGQLNISSEKLKEAETGTGKKYLHMVRGGIEYRQLDTVIRIETGEVEKPVFTVPTPAEKFALLRSEICSWEMLAGMPETETTYMQQILDIIGQVHFVRIMRPQGIRIMEMQEVLRDYLAKQER